MLNPLYGGFGGNLDIGNGSLSVSLIPLFLSKCTVLDYLRVIIIFKLRPESFITQLGLLEQIINKYRVLKNCSSRSLDEQLAFLCGKENAKEVGYVLYTILEE